MRALLGFGIESVRISFSGQTLQKLHLKDSEGFSPAELFFFEAAERGFGWALTNRERSSPARGRPERPAQNGERHPDRGQEPGNVRFW
jgi:hypothetical protein